MKTSTQLQTLEFYFSSSFLIGAFIDMYCEGCFVKCLLFFDPGAPFRFRQSRSGGVGSRAMSKIRIIGGRHRGKRLISPADRTIRPTAERAREALFNILDHQGLTAGARFLDLFAGIGAIGLEAWSRGAAEVWLIDRDLALARANVEALGSPPEIHLRRKEAPRLGAPPTRFDLAFLDPPYRSALAAPTLAALKDGWLKGDALVIVELAAKEPFLPPKGFDVEDERRYGAARFVFLRLARP
jgi:16S rRNA (guanine966-N2)-methyltransferase